MSDDKNPTTDGDEARRIEKLTLDQLNAELAAAGYPRREVERCLDEFYEAFKLTDEEMRELKSLKRGHIRFFTTCASMPFPLEKK